MWSWEKGKSEKVDGVPRWREGKTSAIHGGSSMMCWVGRNDEFRKQDDCIVVLCKGMC